MDGPPSCLRGCADIDELPARRNPSLRWTALHTGGLSEGFAEKNMHYFLRVWLGLQVKTEQRMKKFCPSPLGIPQHFIN